MKRLNIGLMINYIDNEYSKLVIKGAIDAAQKMDVNIIIYPGRGIKDRYDDPKYTEHEFQNNILYEYISKDCLDGVILSAGTVTSRLSAEERKQFVMRYKNLPLLVLENEIEGYPLVHFRSSGMKVAVMHLIKYCGRKKIGFVNGTKGNSEAEERLVYYREALKECGLPIREDYIVNGNFNEHCADLVGDLLDRHKGEIDAICFANDSMCVGGYKALEARGLVPGKDIAVTGYDDSEVALSLNPLLTTVKADGGELGYYAVENLLKMIAGEKVDKITLDSILIVRESSGKYLKDTNEKSAYGINEGSKSIDKVENILIRTIGNYEAMKSSNFITWIKKLYMELIDKINAEQELDIAKYSEQIHLLWEDNKEKDLPLETLANCIRELKDGVISVCRTEHQKLKVSELFMEILGRAYEFSASIQISKRTELMHSYLLINNIKKDMLLSRIAGGDNESAIYESILNNLYRVDFKSSYLYMFQKPFFMELGDCWNVPNKLYLKAYQEKDQLVILDEADQEMEWMSYLKNRFVNNDRHRIMVLNPIFSNEEQYGLFLCELDFEDFSKINFVTPQISYTMKQSNLMRQLEKNVQEIEEAKRIAEKASQAKANFLANMSHEIRTPINAVLGMNEMILRECKDPDITRYAQNISSAGKTLLSLINDVLDISKIELGKLEIIPTDYELFYVLSDLVNMISERSKKKNLKLELNFEKDLPSILYGDEVKLKQIIMNLLTNAVKYTDSGTVTFNMGWKREEEDFVCLLVSVEDTGKGIKEEDIPKLFRAFERIEEKKNRNIEGTGLGISITEQLLELMGSNLEVETVYGKGSKFSFILKQKRVSESSIGSFVERVSEQTAKTAKYHTTFTAPDAQILVVDDSDMNLMVVKNLLKITKLQIDTADSGFVWMEKMKYNHYDLILADHMMPGMDGIETLQRIKEMPDFIAHPIPVIVLTANAIAGSKEKYMEAGFTDYLTKPIESNKLEETLIKYLPKELVRLTEQKEELWNSDEDKSIETEYGFAYISSKRGLHYSSNDRKNYEKILKAYLGEGKKKREILHKALLEEDKKQYMISIHTLKSTSGNIGAEELVAKAERLEVAAKEDNWNYILRNHESTCELYENVLNELYGFFEKIELGKVKKNINRDELMQILNDIKDKIYTLSIVEAFNKLETLKDCICEGNSYEKEVEVLMGMLKAYDVDTAEKYLKKVIEVLNKLT